MDNDESKVKTLLRRFRFSKEKKKHVDYKVRRSLSSDRPISGSFSGATDITHLVNQRRLVRSSSSGPRTSRQTTADRASAVRPAGINSDIDCRGESLRTVVLTRTKKGYGFVLRGAKGESYFLVKLPCDLTETFQHFKPVIGIFIFFVKLPHFS